MNLDIALTFGQNLSMNSFFIGIFAFFAINFLARKKQMDAAKLLTAEQSKQLFQLISAEQKRQFFIFMGLLAVTVLLAMTNVVPKAYSFGLIALIFIGYMVLKLNTKTKQLKEHQYPENYIQQIKQAGYIQLLGFMVFWLVLMMVKF